jgi:tetratricopeptide (TPR) repeat protein
VSYGLLLFSHRRQLHRSIAEWYEKAGSDDLAPYYSLLAYHWSHAEDDEKAIRFFELAGEQALHGGAYREAVIFFRDALALADRAESREEGLDWTSRRACWEEKLGEAHLGLGQLGESRAHTVRGLSLLGHPVPSTGPRLMGEYVRQLARQAWNRLVHDRPTAQSEADRNMLTRASSGYDVISQICYYSQEVSLGVYSALRALNLAERAGPCPELARSYGTMCIAASLVPLHGLAEIYGARAGETVQGIDDWATRAWVSEMRGIYWLSVGRFDASRQELMKAVEITRRIGDWRRWEESLGELARLEYLQGHFALGAERFGELWDVARQQGHEQAQVWGRHGQASNILRQGKVAEAVASLEESPALLDEYKWVADRILGFGLLALARFRLGQYERAREAAEDALRQIAHTRPVANFNLEGYAGTAEVYLRLWERALDAGQSAPNALAERARSACSALRTFARIFPIGRPRSFAWQGLYQWLSGRATRAARSWSAGRELAERMEMPYEEALIHFEIGRHASTDDPSRALHLQKASELFARLGAADDVARLEEVLAPRSNRRGD